jgi:D-amino-acid dehydrogenase
LEPFAYDRPVGKPDVAIVGGGAIGVCCALELARRGAQVTLLERGSALASGCSSGNAGLLCPSHSVPISNPVSLRNGLRWMWKRDSPFYLRPRPAVVPWLARFALASRHWHAGAEAIRAASIASLELHAQLGDELGTGFERTGTLSVYSDAAKVESMAAEASGLRHEVLDADATRELEPALTGPVAGGVFFPDEGLVEPRRFVETIGRAAAEAGAEIRTGAEVPSLDDLQAETVVVAAGAWSSRLVQLPLEGGKGYHVDFDRTAGDARVPVLIGEGSATVAVATPFADRLRLSGTLELAGLDLSISTTRVNAIRRAGERWFGGVTSRPVVDTWAGLRPCLPDGLPAIGRLGRTIVATGHAMKGVSLAPITGRLVAQLVAGEQPDVDLAPFDPNRF